jgi:chromosome segregation ATPase
MENSEDQANDQADFQVQELNDYLSKEQAYSSQLQQDNCRLTSNLCDVELELASCEGLRDDLQEQVEDLGFKLLEKEASDEKLQEETCRLASTLCDLQLKLVAVEAQRDDLEVELADTKAQRDELDAEVSETCDKFVVLLNEKQELAEENEFLETELREIDNRWRHALYKSQQRLHEQLETRQKMERLEPLQEHPLERELEAMKEQEVQIIKFRNALKNRNAKIKKLQRSNGKQ